MDIRVTTDIDRIVEFKQHPHLEEILEKFKQGLQTVHQDNLVHLILFGSQARKNAKKESDIDVLVVLKEKLNDKASHQKIIELISDLCLEYGVLLSCIYVSESQFKQEKSPLLLNIHQQGIVL